MPRRHELSPDHEYERLNPGASADPPQRRSAETAALEKDNKKKNGAALPGSQNADLKGARRDRSPRGMTT
jgi:hypothetical protein